MSPAAYYNLLTAQQRLTATEETLKTARTTQDAAEAQLANGRSTMPDVLNARAETAQAIFDRESADGDEKIARVTLSEAVGAEPSPNISIDPQKDSPLPSSLSLSIDALIDRAMIDRPDLQSPSRRDPRSRRRNPAPPRPSTAPASSSPGQARRPPSGPPRITVNLAQPTRPHGPHHSAWSGASLTAAHAAINSPPAESKGRQARDELTEKRDQTVREVWTSYISFRTALRKQEAAVSLVDSRHFFIRSFPRRLQIRREKSRRCPHRRTSVGSGQTLRRCRTFAAFPRRCQP